MALQRVWRFLPGETRDLAVSLASELDVGASLTGNTPTVSGHTYASGVYTVSALFTFANQAVNTGILTADDGETIAVGDGVQFRCTAPTVQGSYFIRSECDADDGTHVGRFDELIVEGPSAP